MDKTVSNGKTANKVRSIAAYLQNQLDTIYSRLKNKKSKRKKEVTVPIINWKYKKKNTNDFIFIDRMRSEEG